MGTGHHCNDFILMELPWLYEYNPSFYEVYDRGSFCSLAVHGIERIGVNLFAHLKIRVIKVIHILPHNMEYYIDMHLTP